MARHRGLHVLCAVLALMLASVSPVWAQAPQLCRVVATCGTATYSAGNNGACTVDPTGNYCVSESGGGSTSVTQGTTPWAVRLNTTPNIANGSGVVIVPSSESGAAFTITSATSTALEATRAAKASPGNVYGAYVTSIAGGAAGFLVGYNATTCPVDGAVTGSLVLDACAFDTTNKGCSISRPSVPRNYSVGICFYITTGASPFANKATGTDTGFLSVDYN